jgi:hypothetical protein
MEYIKIRSWHVVSTWTRVPGHAITLCGKSASGEQSPFLPISEKSCETCLRLKVKND